MCELSFEEQIKIEHDNKTKKESWERHCKEVRGEYIYTSFCVWCNCHASEKTKKSAQAFAQWLKSNNITLTEYQRRWIAENHFGWQFTWNDRKQEWESKKI